MFRCKEKIKYNRESIRDKKLTCLSTNQSWRPKLKKKFVSPTS